MCTCASGTGHINFNDEVTAGLRLADGVLLVVDAVEGVMLVTDKVLKQAAAEGLPVCLLLSKVRDPLARRATLCQGVTIPAPLRILHKSPRGLGWQRGVAQHVREYIRGEPAHAASGLHIWGCI